MKDVNMSVFESEMYMVRVRCVQGGGDTEGNPAETEAKPQPPKTHQHTAMKCIHVLCFNA